MTSRRWTGDLWWPAILGLMTGCIVVSLVALLQLYYPDWNGAYLVPICALTAVEAYYSYRLYETRLLHIYGGFRFRLFELAGLFVLLQLSGDAVDGRAPLQDNLPRFDAKTVGLFIVVLLSWLAATKAASYLDALSEASNQEPGSIPPSRRLVRQFFWGGALLFVAAGLTQARVAHTLKLPHASGSGPLLNVLLYFLLGMLMLGQVRYTALRQRWRDRQATMVAGLERRWAQYSLVLVGLVAVLALLLPAGHTVGLISVGRAVGEALFSLSTHVFSAAREPLARVLSLITGPSRYFHPSLPVKSIHLPPLPLSGVHVPPHVHVKQVPHTAHSGGGASGSGRWLALLESILFWTAVVVGLLYLLRKLVRRHVHGWDPTGAWSAIRAALDRLWAGFRRRVGAPATLLGGHLPKWIVKMPEGMPPRGVLRIVRLSALSPREQILHYYLSVSRRAERHGFPRRRSQTPQEFGAVLGPKLRHSEADMRLLTEAFVEARYSRHSFEPSDASRARTSWQRVRAALRLVAR